MQYIQSLGMYKRCSATKASFSLSILRCHVYWPQTGNNNNVSAKRSSWVEGQSPGLSETFAIPLKKDPPPASKKASPSILAESMAFFYTDFSCLCDGLISPLAKGNGKSVTDCPPMSSGCALPHHWFAHNPILMLNLAAKHLSSHPLTTDGVVAQKRQTVPLAQDVCTAKLSSTQCKSCFLYLVISNSQCSQCLPNLKLQRAKIPAPSNVNVTDIIDITWTQSCFYYSVPKVSGNSPNPELWRVVEPSFVFLRPDWGCTIGITSWQAGSSYKETKGV